VPTNSNTNPKHETSQSIHTTKSKESSMSVYLSSRNVLHSDLFTRDKQTCDLYVGSQCHYLRRVAKYTSRGNAITMTRRTFVKCTGVLNLSN
jgi:hypothetical protein